MVPAAIPRGRIGRNQGFNGMGQLGKSIMVDEEAETEESRGPEVAMPEEATPQPTEAKELEAEFAAAPETTPEPANNEEVTPEEAIEETESEEAASGEAVVEEAAPEEVATEEAASEEGVPEKVAPEAAEEPQPEGAQVDFDLLETEGRWLLKVLSGPNSGAEFAMHGGSSYLIGTDTDQCDVIFQDLSVSRKHARLTIDLKNEAILEDLESRNGTFVDGERIDKRCVSGNVLVAMGTTTFMLVDREAEQTTIISPLHAEEKEEELKPIEEAVYAPLQNEVERVKEEEEKHAKESQAMSSLVILAIVTALILVVGIGGALLFEQRRSLPLKLLTQKRGSSRHSKSSQRFALATIQQITALCSLVTFLPQQIEVKCSISYNDSNLSALSTTAT